MRTAGSTIEADSGIGGGGGAIPLPVGGDLTGTTSVATVAQIGNATVVSSLAELDAIAPAVGGVRTINQQIMLVGFVFLLAGERIEVGVFNGIIGHAASQCGFIGNVAGPLISGPLYARRFSIVNQGGACLDLYSLTGEIVYLEEVILQGVSAGTIQNVFGSVGLGNVFGDGLVQGFVLQNLIGAMRAERCVFNEPAGPGTFYGWDHVASLTVLVALNYRGTTATFFPAAFAQYLFRFSDAVTWPTPAPPTDVFGAEVTNGVAGPSGTLIFTGAGFDDSRSLPIVVTGGVGARVSKNVGAVAVNDLANPLVVTYGAASTPKVLPWTNLTASLAETAATERFALVRASTGGPPDTNFPDDWAIEYLGTNSGFTGFVNITATIEGASGAQNIQVTVERRPDRVSGWTATNAVGVTEQQQRKQQIAASDRANDITPGTQFRVTFTNLVNVTATQVGVVDFSVGD